MSNSKKEHWTEDQKTYVKDNIGKLPLIDICRHLNKSEMAVNLFVFRNKIQIGPTVKRNILLEMLKIKFVYPEYFTPTKQFYKAVKINQVRWWDLYFGRKQITPEEYISIANHFEISLTDAFNARQLTLFDSDNND